MSSPTLQILIRQVLVSSDYLMWIKWLYHIAYVRATSSSDFCSEYAPKVRFVTLLLVFFPKYVATSACNMKRFDLYRARWWGQTSLIVFTSNKALPIRGGYTVCTEVGQSRFWPFSSNLIMVSVSRYINYSCDDNSRPFKYICLFVLRVWVFSIIIFFFKKPLSRKLQKYECWISNSRCRIYMMTPGLKITVPLLEA